MFGVIGALLLLLLIALTARALLKRGHGKLKLALLLCYGILIAQCVDAYYSAAYADEHNLVGYAADWFGTWWLFALLATVGIVVALHAALYITSRGDAGPARN